MFMITFRPLNVREVKQICNESLKNGHPPTDYNNETFELMFHFRLIQTPVYQRFLITPQCTTCYRIVSPQCTRRCSTTIYGQI